MKQFYSFIILVFGLQFGFGQIGFEENVIIDDSTASNEPKSVHTADIDGDGDMDVLYSSRYKIAWYENINGQGIFGSQQIIDDELFNGNTAYLTDIDGDGDIDVLSAQEYGDNIAWYENLDGQGTFGARQVIYSGTFSVRTVYPVDIDGDGDLDVLAGSYGQGKIFWFENTDGQGTFGTLQIISSINYYANSVYATDIDGDGDMDVLSASPYFDNLYLVWYENTDGQGSFGTQQTITTNDNGALSVYAADIDGDGDMDVLSASSNDDKIAWYENTDGQGSFGTQQVITTNANGAESVYAADIDSDGDMDVLSASFADDKIAWYENTDGQGSFGIQQVITTNADYARSVYATDIDGDGDMDVLSASFNDDKIAWYENTDGQGTFGAQQIIATSAIFARSVCANDIDGDGDMDMLFVSPLHDKIAWYENTDGQGAFGSQQIITTNADDAQSVYASDIDGDGDMDVLSASSNDDKIAWYENTDGQGSFGTQQVITTNANGAESVYAADIDGDGDMDVLSASRNDDKIAWYENTDGQGSFGIQQVITTNADYARSVYVTDIDGDGDMDVLSASRNDDKIAWYENTDGQGSFGTQQMITTSADGAKSVYATDIDGDGDMDVLSASINDNKVAWYENVDGQGSFDTQQIITTNVNSAEQFYSGISVYSADIDSDGDMDVLSASFADDKIAWYENVDGQGTFGTQQIITTDVDGAWSVYAADINSDGDMDVLSASRNDDKIAWYKNLGVQTNEINGVVRLDMDFNGCDASDSFISSSLISTTDGSQSFSNFSLANGFYQLFPGEGNFTTQIQNLPAYYTTNPVSQTTNFVGVGNTDTIDFCIEPTGIFNDLVVSVYPSINDPRPGFDTTYQLVYKNVGTTQVSGSVSFEFDDAKLQFLSASETVTSQTANTLNFDFTDLNPFETRIIDLEFNVFAPPITNIDDVLVSTVTINPITGDETEEDNTFELNQTIIGSYDPNDITVLEGDEIFIEDADKFLHYLIRFQNTGTTSAINVNVEHVLDDKLDWTTMQLESLSHTGRVEIENQTDVSFIFNNINLPDSTSDEPNSHGYIAFKIKPKSNVQVGDIISGVADIYFDFNPPIITNTVNTEIAEPLSIDEVSTEMVKLHPNPAKNTIQITSNQEIESLTVIDINGRALQTLEILTTDYTLDISNLSKGVYFIELQSGESKSTKKFIKN